MGNTTAPCYNRRLAQSFVHLYSQSADIDAILEACDHYGIALIEDAAESLGATYKGRSPGTYVLDSTPEPL
ncbi:DegT/DnrJ/EryC1/StrS aminotransferase [Scytonema sp. HK-05]|nr:hypothetical protein NIES2130_11310 [Scytonema sp. HK-05]BAY47145.1 DegT/DnrJ/EryC1/StrS aminotransferase [Scytonema sp. HK-05]